MDSCISPKRTQVSPAPLKSPRLAHASSANAGFLNSPQKFTPQSQAYGAPESARNINARRKSQPLVVSVANTESKGSNRTGVSTPHELKSPEGMLLSSVLQKHPHLFQFAATEQLNALAASKEEASNIKDQLPSSILQRRIAEIKEKERQVAVEDVIYLSIVHEFTEAEVPMIPKLSNCIGNNTLDLGPSKHRDLECVHSPEVQGLVREHIDRILYNNGKVGKDEGETTTMIDRLHFGQIYASSIMYGYFLKSANFRRQFDSNLGCAPEGLQSHGDVSYHTFTELYPYQLQTLATLSQPSGTNATSISEEPERSGTRSGKLSSYVTGFDTELLQRCAKLKSQEAVNVIEKHTWALFGDEKIGQPGGGGEIVVTLTSLERLTLEAVAFGSFLWDVERSVDSLYSLQQNQPTGN